VTCNHYVPYSTFETLERPKVMDITNHKKRVHLKDIRNSTSMDGKAEVDLDFLPATFDSKRILDLGVAPLQRIINELKSISTESNDNSYDHNVAKASGLVNYCDYIRGVKEIKK
jgi:hypothetical protein